MVRVNGLEGVVVAETELSLVDGQQGRLLFRGYDAADLAVHRTFEEVAHLLWRGHLPTEAERVALERELREYRALPPEVDAVVRALPADRDMMSVLRTAVSALGVTRDWPPAVDDAIRLTAVLPTVIAARAARLAGEEPVAPNPDLGHTANYLYMLRRGQVPAEAEVRTLEAYLVITMEHGLNASTFAGRVVTSTQSDVVSAMTAALGAMKGPLHGGAPSEVMTMLEEIGSEDAAEAWLRAALERGERLMGFGHRVYKTQDPRARALRDVVARFTGADPHFALAVRVEQEALRLLAEYKPGRQLYTNVEYWAAAILRSVGLPKPLYTPTFCCSRMVGWTAHVLEQAAHNRLIRPQSEYVGPLTE
ncbi:MAG: citrate synthase/methylcitrate synthase [Alicyclobacillus sp.]|nr:citrate synthase/methylcitrate synthase [Alicyclobacillus sp.]